MAIDDAILYTRVSSDEQKKSGFSLDYQRKMGEEYAKMNKLNIIKVYAESYTAKKPGRPQFNEMVDYCKKHKVKNLIFLKSDRASRNGVDSALLVYMAEHLDYNIHLIQDRLILNSSARATDFLVFEINNCISNFYPRNLSVDVSTKMREKAEQGYYPSIAPIGYKNERINHRSYLQINPEKAAFIKMIFELYATRDYSFNTLAAKMREMGFKMGKKTPCSRRNIEDILKNPIYIGDFIWKGKRYYNGKHEPIISRELFVMCQRIMEERSTAHAQKHNFLFTNLIKCKKCGCYMVGEIKKEKYIYYHCTGNRGGDCKKGSYIRENVIEDAILDVLSNFELPTDALDIVKRCLKNEMESQNYYNETRIKELEKDIEKTKNRLNKLFDLYLDGEILEEIYKQKNKELQNMLDEYLLRYSSYTKTGVELLKLSEGLFELCKDAKKLYLRGNIEERRRLLKILCSNFYYDGQEVIIAIKKAFQPLVKIAYLLKLGRRCQNSNLKLYVNEFIKEIKENAETFNIVEINTLLKVA